MASAPSHKRLHTVCDSLGWQCRYCVRPISCRVCEPYSKKRQATRDHYRPKSKGGNSSLSNLVPACRECNQEKADRFNMEKKRPTKRSLRGCQYGRSYRDSRRKRPLKGYPSLQLAVLMSESILLTFGREVNVWHCPGCGEWHLGNGYKTKKTWVEPDYVVTADLDSGRRHPRGPGDSHPALT